MGTTALDQQYFRSSPALGVSETILGPQRPYKLPEPRTPVLVISDLGISSPEEAHHEEWLDLAARLTQRGSPLIALVPYGPRRWPLTLTRAMLLVQWDRVTTVSAVTTARRTSGATA